MWNPFKTLTETDSARLRRLESKLTSLEDDVTKTLDLVDRINSRLRQRARRAADAALDTEPDDSAADNLERAVSREPRPALVEHTPSTAPVEGKFIPKEQLRAWARQKGISA